ncbi:NAD(P)/FAD-dependent oxidoreductase [Patescibacteria group bacterium]|nr:NAD(P)/FAD-dependent oxidoreductase [Patescibacteria group bacterium]
MTHTRALDRITDKSEPSHIVILGAGFGGVYTYTSLPRWVKKQYRITVIDRRNHFLFTPLLPEVAGASLDQHSIVEPIRDIINRDVTFIQSTVISVDTNTNTIVLPDTIITYDILVAGLGSKTHFFGTPGAEEHAYILKTLDDAVHLRNRFIDTFETASQTTDPVERKKLLSFVIVGAGPTGVELAGEVSELLFDTFVHQFGSLDIDDVTLTLVNSGDDVLSMFDLPLRQYATRALTRGRVVLRNNVRVTEVTPFGVVTDTGEEISAQTVVWTAGVTANSLTCSCGTFTVDRGRILTDRYLRAESIENVFVIGDMALFPTEDNRGLPMTAQVAKQQGQTTGKNISRLLKGQPLYPFVYHEKGLLASLGSFDAVAQMKGFRFKGVFAWFMWRTIYLFNFASWKKRFKIMADWTVNLFARRDTTRL